MSIPLASVVMAVYNTERFLSDAIESIFRQTFQEYEVIIINDGSTDQTANVLAKLQSTDARVRVFHYEHRGIPRSLNDGCRLANGKYIVRFDGDDISYANRIERQIAFLENHPRVAMVGADVEYLRSDGALTTERSYYPQENQEIRRHLEYVNCFHNSTVTLRKEVFYEVGGYREAFPASQDYDLWLRIADRYELANLPEVLGAVRVHPGSVSVSRLKQQKILAIIARASARARRNGEQDFLWSLETPIPELLERAGVSEQQYNDELSEKYMATIGSLALAGYPQEAERLAHEFLES